MGLRTYLLGTFEVWREGQLILPEEWKREKTRALFKLLLSEPGKPFSQDELIEHLWPALSPQSAASNLRSRVGELRQVLEPQLQQGSQSRYILTLHQGYCFNHEADCWLDVEELAHCYEKGFQAESRGNWVGAIAAYELAAQLYRGEYLAEDRYEEWTITPRERWRALYLDLLSHLAECHARLGQYRRAIARCREMLRTEKYRESAYRQLMLYAYLAGYPSEARRAYEECQTALTELAVPPEPTTQELYQHICQQHIPGIDQLYQRRPVLHHEIPYTLSPGSVPFVGRQKEYTRLVSALEQARQGRGGCVLISGEAGVGKTRLAQEGLAYAHQHFKAPVFQGHSYELGPAYQLWTEVVRESLEHLKREDLQAILPLWVAEVAKLAPELRTRFPHLPENPPLPPQQEQLRFFEGLVQFFFGLIKSKSVPKPLVLFLDDLHWADSASLDFLQYFLPRFEQQPVFILGTYRREEITEEHSLQKLVRAWEPKNLVRVLPLERLKASEVEGLFEELPLKLQRPDIFCQRLYKETEGNPLFLLATLQHFFEEGALRVEGDAWVTDIEDISTNYRELMIPPTVKDLIAQRVARLREPERRLLQLASVIGHDFEFVLLERAWEGNGEHLTALERLAKAQLLTERRGRYEFSHEKIREVAYEEISLPLRQLLHQRVLHGLEQLHGGRLEDWAGALAHHAYRAGAWKKALEYALQALKKAVKEYRQQEALELAELGVAAAQSLAAAGEDRASVDAQRFELLAQRVEIFHQQGRHQEQEQDLAQIEELAQAAGDRRRLALVFQKKCDLHERVGKYPEAEKEALEALKLYQEIGDQQGQGDSLGSMGIVCWNQGRYEEALRYYQRALEIRREIGDPRGQGLSLVNIAGVYWGLGRYEEVVRYHQQAWEIYQKIGDRWGQGITLNNLVHRHIDFCRGEPRVRPWADRSVCPYIKPSPWSSTRRRLSGTRRV